MHFSFRSKINVTISLLLVLSAYFTLAVFTRLEVHAAGSHISLSRNHSYPTASVKVSGKAFGGSETVSLTFDTTPVGTPTTDSTGAFTTTITIPRSALPMNHTIHATGNSSGLTASASLLVQTDWAMYGFNAQHTSYNPYENVLNTSNVSGLVSDWTATIGTYSSAAIYNGVVYVGAAGRLYAYDMASGALLWSYLTTGGILYSSPAVANGIVYIGTLDSLNGKLYALNARTGASVWIDAIGTGFFSSPTVTNGVIYIGSCDDKLYAFNAATGATSNYSGCQATGKG